MATVAPKIAMCKELRQWMAESMARRRSDERLWAIAQTDARLMSELQSALSRSDKDLPSLQSSTQRRVERMLESRQYYI